LSDVGGLEELMRGAGFDDVTVEPAPGGWTFQTPEGEWELMAASPVFEAIQSFAGDRIELVREELLRQVSDRFGTGPVTIPCEAIIALGTKPPA
jgi:hypothetical protein